MIMTIVNDIYIYCRAVLVNAQVRLIYPDTYKAKNGKLHLAIQVHHKMQVLIGSRYILELKPNTGIPNYGLNRDNDYLRG